MTEWPTPQARPYLLTNSIQHYAWGTTNEAAFIPKFLGRPVEPDTPYAELWIGAHPKAPSHVLADGKTIAINEWISRFPERLLGQRVAEQFDNLPFLFKVLSAGQALSIQTHPNKKQAEILHAKDPEHYPDDNHKPEIAIALDHLTALVGFKTLPELQNMLEDYPEISVLMGLHTSEAIDHFFNDQPDQTESQILQLFYTSLLQKSLNAPDQLLQAINALRKRLQFEYALTEADELFLELSEIYTDADIGLFSLYAFNLVHLEKGEGVFLEAGIPHAYVKGNIVECMANSDNVVRAGLTPKFKDIQTLIDIVQYKPGKLPIFKDDFKQDAYTYQTPVPEFVVTRRSLNKGKSLKIADASMHMVLVLEGKAELTWPDGSAVYSQGDVVFIPACLPEYQWKAEAPLMLYEVRVP